MGEWTWRKEKDLNYTLETESTGLWMDLDAVVGRRRGSHVSPALRQTCIVRKSSSEFGSLHPREQTNSSNDGPIGSTRKFLKSIHFL